MKLIADVCRKFNKILSRHQKIRIIELILIMLVGGFLETLSVTVILPFMQVIMNPEQFMSRPYIRVICNTLRIDSDRTLLTLIAILIAIMYLFKNAFLLAEYSVQYRFVYNNRFALQQELLHKIISRPYQFFLHANSGEIMRLVQGDSEASFDVLVNLLNLFTELIVSVMLITTILVMSPTITLCIAGILLCLVIVIYRVVRPRQTSYGKTAQYAEGKKNKWILQSIQGIKEIKVTQKAGFFEKKYENYGLTANTARRKSQLYNIAPRYFIEAVSMAGMFVAVALMLSNGGKFEVIVPTLTVVAMAAIRILPSVNRISFTLSNISFQYAYFSTFVDNILSFENEYRREKDDDDNVMKGNIPLLSDKIEFKDISFKYSGAAGPVFENADMVIRKGESVGIVGGSGAGKTTAVDIILGLLKPQSGQVLIDGTDIMDDMPGWLDQVGYIPQMIFMLDGSIYENVLFGIPETEKSEEMVWNALREASLEDFVRSLPEGLETSIGERGMRLSGGQRQRLGIARALCSDPRVLIFDEATSALDGDTESAIMESIHRLHGQKTMIIIAHRLSTIEACDHIFRVENGKILKER